MAEDIAKVFMDHYNKIIADNAALRTENKQLKKRLDKLEHLEQQQAAQEQEEKDEIGFYIKSQREARKMGHEKFARLLNTTGPTLQNYEKGQGKLSSMQEIAARIQKLGRL